MQATFGSFHPGGQITRRDPVPDKYHPERIYSPARRLSSRSLVRYGLGLKVWQLAPVEQLTKLELVIKMKTAKALGTKIPQSILVQATKVIE